MVTSKSAGPGGTGHGFGNWENPLGTHDREAWTTAWGRTLELLRANVV